MKYLVPLTDVIDVAAVFYSAKQLTLVKWTIKSKKNTKTICSNNIISFLFFGGRSKSPLLQATTQLLITALKSE